MRWPGAPAAPASITRDEHARTRLRSTGNAHRNPNSRWCGGDPRWNIAYARCWTTDCPDRAERRRQDHSAACGHGAYPAKQWPRHLGRARRAHHRTVRDHVPAPNQSATFGRRQCPLRAGGRWRAARRPPDPRGRIADADAPRPDTLANESKNVAPPSPPPLEPTASLDPYATKAIEDIVRAVTARGVKVVMSTHDLGQAKRLAGDVVLLHRGRLIEKGPASEFFADPRTQEARTFIAGELLI